MTASAHVALPAVAPLPGARLRALRLDGWRGYALGTVAWMAFVPLFALQSVVGSAEMGRPMTWAQAFAGVTDSFIACAPMLPLLGWMVRRAPFHAPHWVRNGALLLLGVAAAACVRHWLLAPLLLPILARKAPHVSTAAAVGDMVFYLAVVAALHGKLYYQRLRAQEVEAARLAQRLAETQLLALRAQLQPHFLFNTLNAISALMRDEPDVADRMLTRLAEMLRVVLEPPPGDEHTLGEELSVLERYLEIMSLRFGARLAVEIAVPAALHAACVPWLVLQPIVENAIEHGAGRRRGGVRVRIRAEELHGDRLALVVCDDGPGPSGGAAREDGRRRGGIGLENTRRRLAQLYGSAATLSLDALPEGGACARVELPRRDGVPRPGRTGEYAAPLASTSATASLAGAAG
jgi:signal transduction histidine kinase